MAKPKACKECNSIVEDQPLCPYCKKPATLSRDFSGLLIIMNPEKSEIAKKVGKFRSGHYAIRVR